MNFVNDPFNKILKSLDVKNINVKANDEADEFGLFSPIEDILLCNGCGGRFKKKARLINHLKKCSNTDGFLSCKWCDLKFRNKGNLAAHCSNLHCDDAYACPEQLRKKAACTACLKRYMTKNELVFHIRRDHFNLISKTVLFETLPLNETWIERVQNSDIILEMKKTGQNIIVMRKCKPTDITEFKEKETQVVDLSYLYPTSDYHRSQCRYCKKWVNAKNLTKHINEVHIRIKNHHCSKCGRSFCRQYQYIHHDCGKTKRRYRRKAIRIEI